jgi:drug/metabolite transporter (DMT)-like permease
MKKIRNITNPKAILFALLAATLYALSTPVSKLLLEKNPPTMMASFLYLGAGIGLVVVGFVKSIFEKSKKKERREQGEKALSRKDMPFVIAMVLLDVAAPIFLMTGLIFTSSANVALLNNFEIVVTSLIALFVFKELISPKLWTGIILVTIASVLLSFEDVSSLQFSKGSILVLCACVCWGFENNCTRILSITNPLQIVVIKGLCSGTVSLVIALVKGERFSSPLFLVIALVLGFFAYGLSILFYIYAQRDLGAAKTSSYYAVAPFLSSGISLVIFKQVPSISFLVAVVIMCVGTYFVTKSE